MINAGRQQDNNIELFGDILYTLIYCQKDNFFEKIRMNKQTIDFLKREYKGVSEIDLIKYLLYCDIIEDNELGNEIIIMPFYSEYLKIHTTKSIKIIFDGDDLK